MNHATKSLKKSLPSQNSGKYDRKFLTQCIKTNVCRCDAPFILKATFIG